MIFLTLKNHSVIFCTAINSFTNVFNILIYNVTDSVYMEICTRIADCYKMTSKS